MSACAGTTVDPEPSAAPSEQAASATPAQPPAPVANAPAEPAPESDPLAPLLREIASAYRSWGMVDNQFHWAPGLCAMPMEGVAHMSAAAGDGGHAQKVFVLYAADAMAYWKATDVKAELPSTLAPAHTLSSRGDVRQVLVKESFVPAKPGSGTAVHAHVRAARKDGESFVAGEPMGLFVMAQLAGKPADTDDGWIYATIAPDGAVRESGVIASCRDCHAQQRDRIFGVPLAWQ
ncbi:MAG: cytochrome P460 family protein [Nannocystaceae bacterium]